MLLTPCVFVLASCVMAEVLKPVGFVTSSVRRPDGVVRAHTEPYYPQAGDIVLFDDHNRYWLVLYRMVGSAPPTHSGMVVQLPHGQFALRESGQDDCSLLGPYVALLDLEARLRTFNRELWIRRVKEPLCPERCDRLRQFAFSQIGKRYATCRLLLQGTPFRCRNWLTRTLFGRTYLNRVSWLCSELVVAAGTAAGLFNPKLHPANAIYPRDMVEDTTFDLSGVYHKVAVWSAERPNSFSGEPQATAPPARSPAAPR